jgi:hypothetical protein
MEGFTDIEGPVRLDLLMLLGLAGLILLAILLIVALISFLVRRKSGSDGEGIEFRRSPLEIALERLHLLESEGSSMAADPFVVEVSDVVRDYLESSLKIPAREQTSEEFLHELASKKRLPEILQANMPSFLEQCDLVKFARQALAHTQRGELLDTASTVVRETDASLLESDSGKETEG